MSSEERTVPIPRPRQLKSTSDETDSASRAYENFTIKPPPANASFYDDLNAQLSKMKVEMQKPMPMPRSNKNRNYENQQLNNINNNSSSEQPQSYQQPDLPPKTGAIRKTSNIPQEDKLNNNSSRHEMVAEHADEVRSNSSSTSGKSGSDKFQTPSPSDILKSIGGSTKMLTEAIGERIGDKTIGARHKIAKEYKNSLNVLENFASETKSNTAKKLKNVREKMSNLSLSRNKVRRSISNDGDERPQTINIGSDEMFQSLTFNSPMNNVRSYNLENIPGELNSTYETPKAVYKQKSNEELPRYEDVVHNSDFLKRNTQLTKSLNEMIRKNNLEKNKNKSDTRLNTISSEESSSDESDKSPPKMPAPVLPAESPYGKVRKILATDYENAPMIPLRKPPPPPTDAAKKREAIDSNRATISSLFFDDNSLTLQPSVSSENSFTRARDFGRSDSWSFVNSDNVSRITTTSTDSEEPLYANDENERIGNQEPPKVELPQGIIQPIKILNTDNQGRNSSATLTREILSEFDPLSRESFDNYIMRSMNHITLLETLLSEETYGTVADSHSFVDVEHTDEDSSEDLNRSESVQQLNEIKEEEQIAPAPLPPQRTKNNRQTSVIIHQNLKLKDSIENLAEPYLAKVDDQPSTSGLVDLSKPKPSKTNWFVEGGSENFVKNNLDNPNNLSSMSSNDKVTKSIPQLQKINNLNANQDTSYLPSYEESKNDEIVNTGGEETPTNPITKSRSSIFNFNLRRKHSLKEKKVDPKDFIERPPFSEEASTAHDKNMILFKLPSGVIEDMLKELNPRFVELKKRQFRAFADPDMKSLKEHLDMTYLTSVHYLVNHKFSDFKTDCGRQIYCFEINLAIPKGNALIGLNMLDNKGSPVKTQRVTYVYGIHSKQEKCMWMQKVIRGVTNVFPKEYTCDYVRGGWCYMKKSITSVWMSTWVLLARRKLLFYDFAESRLEILDLRKARCIGLKESDESIANLYVEKGPVMLIDCPPYTCYFIMNNTRETRIWSVVIKDEAHTNGSQLRHQQLTKDNVPVFVDKCINFVYTNGTMCEGVYRKAGSSSNIQKLTAALRKDAFSVQITRSEYNEHDVSSALKRFFRELPDPLMGKLAVSFLSVSELKSFPDKIQSYRELLKRLPTVEYQTLKKLLGHLHFIQTQRDVNKMKAENLAMVFGPTLMQPSSNENHYTMDTRDNDVIAELILNYKKLYDLTPDEMKTEQIMLTVLKKYHDAAENLANAVKKSGDFKVWITLDPNPELNTEQEDKKQINVALTPTKTVLELCKEFETQMNLPAHKMTLMEIILNGELQRPLHYNEKVLNIVLRWSNWPEADRKTNFLELKPQTKFQQQIERAMKTQSTFTPCMETKFADKKTKSMKCFTLELCDTTINVLKTDKSSNIKVNDVDVSNCVTYMGSEKKRDCKDRWALTLVELNFNKRSRDSPFIGHIIAGNNINDQITWYTSIMYSLYNTDISPPPEIVMT